MSKKKKHIQTEKEQQHQEEAARLRAEKAEQERRRKRKTAFLWLGIALFALMAALVGVNIGKMRNYELHYTKTYGTVTGIRLHNRPGWRNDRHYYLIFSYTADGVTYSVTDIEGYNYSPDELIGERLLIYVSARTRTGGARFLFGRVFDHGGICLCARGDSLCGRHGDLARRKEIFVQKEGACDLAAAFRIVRGVRVAVLGRTAAGRVRRRIRAGARGDRVYGACGDRACFRCARRIAFAQRIDQNVKEFSAYQIGMLYRIYHAGDRRQLFSAVAVDIARRISDFAFHAHPAHYGEFRHAALCGRARLEVRR